jgi:hypothetical protein
MNRDDLQRLSKDDLIELVLRLHRPARLIQYVHLTGTSRGFEQANELRVFLEFETNFRSGRM